MVSQSGRMSTLCRCLRSVREPPPTVCVCVFVVEKQEVMLRRLESQILNATLWMFVEKKEQTVINGETVQVVAGYKASCTSRHSRGWKRTVSKLLGIIFPSMECISKNRLADSIVCDYRRPLASSFNLKSPGRRFRQPPLSKNRFICATSHQSLKSV